MTPQAVSATTRRRRLGAFAMTEDRTEPPRNGSWLSGRGRAAGLRSLSGAVLFSANTADPKGYQLVEKYNVSALPTVLVITPDGVVDDAVVGLISAEGFNAELERIQRGEKTVSAFRKQAAAAPEDVDVQYALAVKLQDCGDLSGYEEVVGALKAHDPHGEHLTVARLLLADVQEPIVKAAARDDGSHDFAAADLEPLQKFLKQAKHEELRYEGWAWAAEVEREGGHAELARKATMKAWGFASEEQQAGYGGKVAFQYLEEREELSKADKKFALKVALASHKATLKGIEKRLTEAEEYPSGCASLEGCGEGEGCGGCGGAKGEVVYREADALEIVAVAYFLNGKRRKAIETLEQSLELVPEREEARARLAMFKNE